MRSSGTLAVITLLFTLGCSDSRPAPEAASQVSVPPAAPATDQWLGQWTGPEGTFLRIAGGQGKYEITVQNLDGPRTFTGTASGDRIQFERDGVVEQIRATDGAGTGMKWLSEKANCLAMRSGEGYCRD